MEIDLTKHEFTSRDLDWIDAEIARRIFGENVSTWSLHEIGDLVGDREIAGSEIRSIWVKDDLGAMCSPYTLDEHGRLVSPDEYSRYYEYSSRVVGRLMEMKEKAPGATMSIADAFTQWWAVNSLRLAVDERSLCFHICVAALYLIDGKEPKNIWFKLPTLPHQDREVDIME